MANAAHRISAMPPPLWQRFSVPGRRIMIIHQDRGKQDMKRIKEKTEGRRSMRRLILYAMFFCIVLFLIVGLAGLFFLSNSYYAEFARNQNELLESYYHYLDKCMEDAARTSLRIIADDSVQQSLREITVSSGAKLAQAKTDLHDAVVASVAEISGYGYIRSVIVSDCHGAIYSFGGIPQNAQLQASIQRLIEQTDASGKARWFFLNWEGQPYLVLGRAIRETKNLSLNVLGYEMILIHFEQMARQAEPADSTFAESLETYLDGQCFYRGSQCPEAGIGLDIGASWKIMTLNGTRYFVSSASFLDNRLTLVSYVNYSRLTSLLRNAGRNMLFLLALLILFCAAFFQLVTKRIFRHLDALTEAVRNAPAGDYRVTLSPELLHADDEVGILAKQFQHLMHQMSKGGAATIFTVTDSYTTYAAVLKDNFGAVPLRILPGAAATKAMFVKPSQFLSISATAEKVEEAAKFIDYWVNDEEANLFIAGRRGVPINPDIATIVGQSLNENSMMVFEYMNLMAQYASDLYAPDPQAHSEIADEYNRQVQAVLYGESTPEAAAEALVEYINKALNQ